MDGWMEKNERDDKKREKRKMGKKKEEMDGWMGHVEMFVSFLFRPTISSAFVSWSFLRFVLTCFVSYIAISSLFHLFLFLLFFLPFIHSCFFSSFPLFSPFIHFPFLSFASFLLCCIPFTHCFIFYVRSSFPSYHGQVRLPGPFLCYTPPSDAPEPEIHLPALKNGFVCFGSFNNLAKVNDSVLDLWCEILRRVPYSRMVMKCKPFACPRVRDKVAKAFQARVSQWHWDLGLLLFWFFLIVFAVRPFS